MLPEVNNKTSIFPINKMENSIRLKWVDDKIGENERGDVQYRHEQPAI
jgi:hypothetical protein